MFIALIFVAFASAFNDTPTTLGEITTVDNNGYNLEDVLVKKNVTLTNVTFGNELVSNKMGVEFVKEKPLNDTIGLEKNITELYYDVVINEPVKWEKSITLNKKVKTLSVELPAKAEDIIVHKLGKEDVGLSLESLDEIAAKTVKSVPFEIKDGNLEIKGPLKGAIVEYYMPGPVSKEVWLNSWKKQIVVSSDEHYENILTYTKVDNVPEDGLNLYHLTEKGREKIEFVSYDKDEDGNIDYIEWITPSLSNQTYELEIIVLNIQSYPSVGGNWTVMFNTTGTADLIITGQNGTFFGEDLEVFEKAKMSMKEYGESMMQYEERLGNVIASKINFEGKKNNLFKFKARRNKILEEREKLVELIRSTQEAYITKGKFETRIYENMLKSYSERLSDIEEKLALLEVKRAQKGSLVKEDK